MFANWIKKEYGLESARSWLHSLGFHYQKGIYFDGHECEDVVQLLANVFELG